MPETSEPRLCPSLHPHGASYRLQRRVARKNGDEGGPEVYCPWCHFELLRVDSEETEEGKVPDGT
jgi:hypothetical protein